nr:hypothetical protein CFP56_18440 [Quercus suber]
MYIPKPSPMDQAYQEHYPQYESKRFFPNGSNTLSIIPCKEAEDFSLLNIILIKEAEDSSLMNPSTFKQSPVWKLKILPRSILSRSSTPKVSLLRKQKILPPNPQDTMKKAKYSSPMNHTSTLLSASPFLLLLNEFLITKQEAEDSSPYIPTLQRVFTTPNRTPSPRRRRSE